jgi:hypothetical protein
VSGRAKKVLCGRHYQPVCKWWFTLVARAAGALASAHEASESHETAQNLASIPVMLGERDLKAPPARWATSVR